MSLQFIIGSSGTGKSFRGYQSIIEQAGRHPERLYYIIVPEQFTMQTQRTLVEMSPGKGILNIDILSFGRLAYRVLEEVGGDSRKLLEDTGKSMVLRKLVQRNRKNLPYLGSQMNKPGYLDEVKSLLSEFMQYDIREEELGQMEERAADRPLLGMKLRDVGTLYRDFRAYLEEHYMTNEEAMDILLKDLPFSEKLKDSTLLLDGFTGFTPIQNKVIRELLLICRKVSVTVTMDAGADPFAKGKAHQLFYMSRKMLHTLSGLTNEMEEPILLMPGKNSRFAKAPALQFLERNLFRYRRAVYGEEQDEIHVFCAATPQAEMEEAARRMAGLVRTRGYRYGEMAVITGNLDEYGRIARQVFDEAGIPYFLDEKHTVLMNPFVEYLRAAVEMAVQNFSYESVFRYLRCGMSGLTRRETDRLENYVLALGIRGYNQWKETWVRIYCGMAPGEIPELNQSRQRFVEEAGILAEAFGGGSKTVGEYCRELYRFIVNGSIQKKLKLQETYFKAHGDKAMEKEYGQIYGIVMELLDKMVEILGEESINLKDFRQLLETGLGEAEVALIPPSMDQVLVGDMERTRLKDVKALFFVGVNEGNIPKNTGTGGILTELDRDFFAAEGLELAPGPKELMNIQRFYLYLNLTKPQELLCLSYSLSDSRGEALSPAYLINSIRSIFKELKPVQVQGRENAMELPELPGTGLAYFLKGLTERAYEQEDSVFQELYSWYLRNPRYREKVQRLVEASFSSNPRDVISRSVAKALYGEISPYGATRLERFSACALAHFLQYGLRLSERAEYEFRALDMGNVMHMALEKFAEEVHKEGEQWADLTEEKRTALIDSCLDMVAADYGNTVLKSSARNAYMIERTRRILRRTVWALQEQLRDGEFRPESFEVSFGGGRIDRVDIMEEEDKVYVRVMDYKTGDTSFDLTTLYHGLQLQLMIYMDAALRVEEKKYPGKEIIPAGIFYYNIKDPLIRESLNLEADSVDKMLLKKLKLNGLVQADRHVILGMDRSQTSIPVAFNSDGGIRKGSSVATREQFQLLNQYVKKKISDIRQEASDGAAQAEPYELGKKNACTYCPYSSACGFDKKIPGYEFRRLKTFSDDEVWRELAKEVQ